MNAVAYIRRSKASRGAAQKKFTDRTVSLVVQADQIREYAARIGATVVRTVVHDGVSGGDPSRFIEIHDAILQGAAKILIVYNLDRLARDTEAFLANCRVLARRGVDLHVVGRGRIDLTTASGKLLGTVEAAMAEHYRMVISEKTKDALALRRAQGRRVSRFAPFGYRFVGRPKRQLLEPYAEQQLIIREIYNLRDRGWSYRDIGQHLAVHLSTISNVLKRRK